MNDHLKEKIDKMDSVAMAKLIRFGDSNHAIIRDRHAYEYMMDKFRAKGGWTPELSKQIGLEQPNGSH